MSHAPFLRLAGILLIAISASTSPIHAQNPTERARVFELHKFYGGDGQNPRGNLISDTAGNLYGTTEYGGMTGYYGTVFELSPAATAGGEWTFTTLYTFKNHGDGARPTSGLLRDASGNLYGTTSDDNAGGLGEIFELSPPSVPGGEWTEAVLYSFTNPDDGGHPFGGLVVDEAGNLFGATETSVFELSPPSQPGGPWSFTLLHQFKCCANDGWSSEAGLARDSEGNLYGTTLWGGLDGSAWCGSTGCGTVFMLSPPSQPGDEWTETILHRFWGGSGPTSTDGFNPIGGLALDAQGNVYGTTYSGGLLQGGILFKLSPPSQPSEKWVEHIIHDFAYTENDGAAPVSAPIVEPSGSLLGTTMFGGKACFYDETPYGCGVIYRLIPPASGHGPWHENIVYRFDRAPNSPKQPGASILEDSQGHLFGTSIYGGYANCKNYTHNCGTVFEMIP